MGRVACWPFGKSTILVVMEVCEGVEILRWEVSPGLDLPLIPPRRLCLAKQDGPADVLGGDGIDKNPRGTQLGPSVRMFAPELAPRSVSKNLVTDRAASGPLVREELLPLSAFGRRNTAQFSHHLPPSGAGIGGAIYKAAGCPLDAKPDMHPDGSVQQGELPPGHWSAFVAHLCQDLEAIKPLRAPHGKAFLGLLLVAFDDIARPSTTVERRTPVEMRFLLRSQVLSRRAAPFLELLVEVGLSFPLIPLCASEPLRTMQSVDGKARGLPDVSILRLTGPPLHREELSRVWHSDWPCILCMGSELWQQVVCNAVEVDAASAWRARRSTEEGPTKEVAHHHPLTLVKILVPITSNDERPWMLEEETVKRANELKGLMHRDTHWKVD
eukprot:4835673-Amphidinium_carterae.2